MQIRNNRTKYYLLITIGVWIYAVSYCTKWGWEIDKTTSEYRMIGFEIVRIRG